MRVECVRRVDEPVGGVLAEAFDPLLMYGESAATAAGVISQPSAESCRRTEGPLAANPSGSSAPWFAASRRSSSRRLRGSSRADTPPSSRNEATGPPARFKACPRRWSSDLAAALRRDGDELAVAFVILREQLRGTDPEELVSTGSGLSRPVSRELVAPGSRPADMRFGV